MHILNVRCDNLTLHEGLKAAVDLIQRPVKTTIFYLNLDGLHKALNDPEYRQILCRASLVVPDGIGLKAASHLAGQPLKEKWPVTDFYVALVRRLHKEGKKIFLLGCQEGVAEGAAQTLKREIPGIEIAGTLHGFSTEQEMIERVNRSNADVLLAGLGSPLQEKWIWKNLYRLKPQALIGVGALFNWLSGHQKRSPELMRKMNLEWLWRIFLEPRRLARRYLVEGVGVLLALVSLRLRHH